MRAALCLATLALTVSLPMASCQNGGLGSLLQSRDAMALLSPSLKDAANGYLANINALVSSLSGVTSLQDAVNIAPKIEPAARDASKAYNVLAAASPEERALLWEAFGPKFDSANSGFIKQAARVNENGLWGRALKAGLDEVRLFSR